MKSLTSGITIKCPVCQAAPGETCTIDMLDGTKSKNTGTEHLGRYERTKREERE